ncbi:MAG: 1,4-alpha-glucan branching enzyme, partial [Gammaproteobacteria bacterium]|nr:1,4-alpha-glucan branching enzyme [Gammaproteobacteria bacterium]
MPDTAELDAIVNGTHANPFRILGVHRAGNNRVVRTFQPGATTVSLLDSAREELLEMDKLHAGGVFAGVLPARLRHYLLRVTYPGDVVVDVEDAYR